MNNKPDNRQLKLWMSTIVFTVILFAAVNNLEAIASFLKKIASLLSPMGLGIGLALILNVPMQGIENLLKKIDKKRKLSPKMRNTIALIAVLLLTPVALVAIVLFIVPEFVEAIDGLIVSVNKNSQEIIAFTSKFGLDSVAIQELITKASNWINENMRDILNVTLNVTFTTAMSIFTTLTSGLMSIVLAIYILADRKRISRSTRRILFAFLPKRIAAYTSRTCTLFITTFSRFLSMQCLDAFILAAILFIVMLIANIPYAMSISCLTMIFALIPYVGAFVSLVFGAVIILLESPNQALVFVIVFLIVQQFEGNIIYPRVVGESVGLPAYLTLFAVSIGGTLMGMAGMMLFVPIVSVIYTLIDEAVNARIPAVIDNLFDDGNQTLPTDDPPSASEQDQADAEKASEPAPEIKPAEEKQPQKKKKAAKGKKHR